MTDAADAVQDGQPTVEHAALAAEQLATDPDEPLGLTSEATSTQPVAVAVSPTTADAHPEYAVGAAFAGGLAVALLLKRLAR